MSPRSHDYVSSATTVELDDDDRARLAALHAVIAPQLPRIADHFYARLGAADLRAELGTAMVAWLEAVLVRGGDRALAATRAELVRQHVRCTLPPLWRTMNMLRGECDSRIAELFPASEALQVTKSADKLLDREIEALFDAVVTDSARSAAADRVASIQTLSTGFAHELRNPINAARLKLEVVERRIERFDPPDPKIADALRAIDHELARITRLLQEFLAFARPSELVLGEEDLVPLIQGVLASERAAANERGVVLEPFHADPCVASVDGHKFLQVIQNLVHNAVEACHAGGHVSVTARTDDEQMYLAVVDSGPGIPDDVRQRIFEPFFTTKDQGTGLGLSIVHSFVMQHGGTIDVHSTERGSRFEVTLPRRADTP